MNVTIDQNNGIISTGSNAQNTVIQNSVTPLGDIDWDRLAKEINDLEKNPDAAVKQFAAEAAEAIDKKDSGKVKAWLSKWIPCISKFVETSYYILEIAARFGINI